MSVKNLDGSLKKSYRTWSNMIRRCTDPKSHIWKYYGGRGISVCERWSGYATGYRNFVEDMGEKPAGLTLDRIDNNGNYEPGNCQWATWKEQAGNRRKTGPTENPNSIRQQAIKAGLPYMVVYLRIKAGWPEHLALSTPKLANGQRMPR